MEVKAEYRTIFAEEAKEHLQEWEQSLLSLVPGMADVRIGDQVRFNITHERLHCFQMDGTRIQA